MINKLIALTFPGGKSIQDPVGTNTFIGRPVSNVGDIVTALLFFAIILGGFISTLYFLFGAVRFITSGGDPKAVAGARGQIVGAIIGFLIVLASYLILQFLDNIIGARVTEFLIPTAQAANIGDFIPIGGAGNNIRNAFPDTLSFGNEFASLIIRIVFMVGFIAAFIVIIIGGIKYMTAGGDEKAVGDARRMIALAIVGLLLLFGAMIFLGIVQALTFIPFIKGGPVVY